METTSLTEAVEQLFAQNGVDEIARRFIEKGSDAYAASGESLDQVELEVETFEIKVPLKAPIHKEYFEGFCAHITKQAEMFFEPPKGPMIATCALDLRTEELEAANHELALAA